MDFDVFFFYLLFGGFKKDLRKRTERFGREERKSRNSKNFVDIWEKALLPLLRLFEQSDHRHIAKLLATLEEGDLQNEQVADELATELPDKFARSRSRSA